MRASETQRKSIRSLKSWVFNYVGGNPDYYSPAFENSKTTYGTTIIVVFCAPPLSAVRVSETQRKSKRSLKSFVQNHVGGNPAYDSDDFEN